MDEETVALELPEPHFTLFNCMREGLVEVILVNDRLVAFAHNRIFPWHLRINIDFVELAEDQMPTPAEGVVLFEMGDEIEAALETCQTPRGSRNCLLLASSTWNQHRELYFQVHDPEIVNALLQRLMKAKVWNRLWDYEMSHDPEWEKVGYLFQLFPERPGCDA